MNLPTIPEREVQRTILQYLAFRRIPAVRFNSGAVTGEYKGKRRFVRFASVPGVSDIGCVLPPHGRSCWIEVKKVGGKLTDDQRAFMDLMAAAGAVTIVAESVDDVVKALEAS